MTDTAKTVAACAQMRRHDRLDTAPEPQVRLPDNAGAGASPPKKPTGKHGRDAVDELCLAYGPHLDRAG